MLVIALLVSGQAQSFELSPNFWVPGFGTFLVDLEGSSPSGSSWNSAFKAAAEEWNQLTEFEFRIEDRFQDPCVGLPSSLNRDGATGVNFTEDQCGGNSFGSSTLAITFTFGTCFDFDCDTGFNIEEADIVFNSAINWDVYEGDHRSGSPDFQRVSLHELGHALGLRHEEQVPSIMARLVSDISSLQADDIAGANAIYDVDGTRNTSSYRSVYGVDVLVPSRSIVTDSSSFKLDGELATTDGMLDGKPIDLVQVTLLNDSTLTVDLQSDEFDEFLYLVRVDNTQQLVAGHTFVDSNSGPGGDPRISQDLQAGTYWLGVTADNRGANGNYSLNIAATTLTTARNFARVQSSTGPIIELNSNPIIDGRLGVGDFDFDGKFIDIFQFEILTTTRLLVEVRSTDFDAEVIVARILPGEQIDPSFFAANLDRFTGQTDAGIVRTFTPGTYWVAATSTGSAAGAYRVAISVEN